MKTLFATRDGRRYRLAAEKGRRGTPSHLNVLVLVPEPKPEQTVIHVDDTMLAEAFVKQAA